MRFLTAAHRARGRRAAWPSWPSWWGICRWRWRRPPAYLEQTRIGLDDYLELLRGRARELFGLDRPRPRRPGRRDRRRRISGGWRRCGRCRWTRSATRAPAAEALLTLCAFLGPDRSPARLPTEHPEVLPDAAGGRWSPTRCAYNNALRRARPLLAGRPGPDRDRGAPAGAGGDPGPPRPDRGTGDGASARSRCCGRRSRTTAGRPAPGPTCEQLLPQLLAVAEHAERLAVAGSRRGGCSTGRRPICGSGASTGRRARWPSARSPSPRRRSAPTTSTWLGGTTSWAACCGSWGT